MKSERKPGLTLGQRLEMMALVLSGEPLRPFLDRLASQELVEAHGFLWDKMVEFHYLTQPGEFVRENVTRHMVPSATYQHQQGCDLRLDYCKGVECIWSNAACAGNKIKNNMEVMALTIQRYCAGSAKDRSSASERRLGPQEAILV